MKNILSYLKLFFSYCLILALTSCAQQQVQHQGTTISSRSTFLSLIKKPSQHIVLLVPLKGQYGPQGKVVRNGFIDAYKKLPRSERDNIKLTVLDREAFTNAEEAYQAALNEKPTLIIGPLSKLAVSEVEHRQSLPVPTLALNLPDPEEVSPINFYSFSLNPNHDAENLAAYMRSANIKYAILVAPQTAWGKRMIDSFSQAWQSRDGKVLGKITYLPTTDITNAYQHFLTTAKASDLQHAGLVILTTGRDGINIVPVIEPQASHLPIFALPTIYHADMSLDNRKAISDTIFQSTPWLMYGDSLMRQTYTRLYPHSSGGDIRLYGFGHDAFLVSFYFLKHHTFEGININGHMGYLTLGQNHIIKRQMPWVKMLNGQFVILDNLPTIKPNQDFLG